MKIACFVGFAVGFALVERAPTKNPKIAFARWCLDTGYSSGEKYPGSLQEGFSSSKFYYKKGYQYFIVPSAITDDRQELRECYSGKYNSTHDYSKYKGVPGGFLPKAYWSNDDRVSRRMKVTFDVQSVGRPACVLGQKDSFGFTCTNNLRNNTYYL